MPEDNGKREGIYEGFDPDNWTDEQKEKHDKAFELVDEALDLLRELGYPEPELAIAEYL